MARFSTMQLYRFGHSLRPMAPGLPLLLTVPAPTTLPARTLRVLQMCAINWPKWKLISAPASHIATLLQREAGKPYRKPALSR